jgi:hypothetical protein
VTIDIDLDAVEAFRDTAEFQALGVLGRERALFAEFPELEARHRALTARHVEREIHDIAPPVTPDPDE